MNRRRRPRALVTRPRASAGEIVAELKARGYDVVVEPILDIRFFDGPALPLEGVAGLIFTSANGVRAFAGRSGRRDLPVYAVGDATARAAREAHFERVLSAGGDVESLADLVCRAVQAQRGRLLHIAGTEVAGDLKGRLEAAGYDIERLILYDAVPADRLSTRTQRLLGDGHIDVVVLFSPRTALTFIGLSEECGLNDAFRKMTAVCLSSAVAAAVARMPWKQIRTAGAPTLVALLATLEETGPACNDNG